MSGNARFHKGFTERLHGVFCRFFEHYPLCMEMKDPEMLHQTRVSLRIFLTLCNLTLDAIPDMPRGQILLKLVKKGKEIQRQLGSVRDADVHLMKMDKYFFPEIESREDQAVEDSPFRDFVLEKLNDNLEDLRVKTAKELGKNEHLKLLALFKEFKPEKSCKDLTKSKLMKVLIAREEIFDANLLLYKKAIRNSGPRQAKTIRQMHKVRLKAKFMRYALIQTADLLNIDFSSRAAYYEGIQDKYGRMNDYHNLSSFLKKMKGSDKKLHGKALKKLLKEIKKTMNVPKPSPSLAQIFQPAHDVSMGKQNPDQVDIQNSATDKDNLCVIKGLGPGSEKLLNTLGIHTFQQLASMDIQNKNLRQLYPALLNRLTKGNWPEQARKFCSVNLP